MSQQSSSRPFYRRPLFWITGLFLSLPLIPAVLWMLETRAIRADMSELRAAGFPASGSELNDYYVIPPDETDSTDLWLKAIHSVAGTENTEAAKRLPFIGNCDAPVADQEWEQLPAAREFLASLSEQFALIDEAAQAGGVVRFPVDFSEGIEALLPDTQTSRTVARLLLLNTHVSLRDGDSDRALQDVISIFRLSDSLRAEPCMISQLIRFAIQAIGCEATDQLLKSGDMSDSELADLQSAIGKADFKQSVRDGLIGERAITLTELDRTSLIGLTNANKREALRLYEHYIAAVESPWHETIKRQQDFSDDFAARGKGLAGLRYVPVRLLLPATDQYTISAARCAARQRTSILLIAAERHRQKFGAFPDSLSHIAPELIPGDINAPADFKIDPFTGETLRYQISEDRVAIYSVGRNGEDDQGVFEAERGELPDIGFSLKRR